MEQKKLPTIQYNKVEKRRKVTKAHTHEYYELYYLVSGQTAYFVGDEIYNLMPTDFIMVPKGVIHSTDSQSCLHNERLLITFTKSDIDERVIPSLYELCKKKHIQIPAANKYIFEQILLKMQKEEDQQGILFSLYISELIELLCRHKAVKTHTSQETQQLIDNVAEYIRSNYSKNLDLHSIGRHFGLSECSLSRKFKAETGIGLCEYITQVRIYNAEKILKTRKTSITEVAERCGFSDSNYFATVFKRITGTTPLKYKKRI